MRRLNGPFIEARKLGGNWVRFEAWLESTSVLHAAWSGNYGSKLQKVAYRDLSALPLPPCYLFGSNARMCREPRHMDITTSLPAATEINCHGRRANLFPWTDVYHVYWLAEQSWPGCVCVSAGFISNFSGLDLVTGRTRESRRENGTTRVLDRNVNLYTTLYTTMFRKAYYTQHDTRAIGRAKPVPIVAIRDYRRV